MPRGFFSLALMKGGAGLEGAGGAGMRRCSSLAKLKGSASARPSALCDINLWSQGLHARICAHPLPFESTVSLRPRPSGKRDSWPAAPVRAGFQNLSFRSIIPCPVLSLRILPGVLNGKSASRPPSVNRAHWRVLSAMPGGGSPAGTAEPSNKPQQEEHQMHGDGGSHSTTEGRGGTTASEVGPTESDRGATPLPVLSWPTRSRYCGTLRAGDEGARVDLCGWVAAQRRLGGGVTFATVRDHTGVVQIAGDQGALPEAASELERVRLEWVVRVRGVVRLRPADMRNPAMETGEVEVVAEEVEALNPVRGAMPFPVMGGDGGVKEKEKEKGKKGGKGGGGKDKKGSEVTAVKEEVRLRYRPIDLRRADMQRNIRMRHQVVKCLRRFLEDELDFVEIETPILTRSTPEGARDYLVPSRTQPGSFFALPQSPQLFKQMLMVAAFDRYYQLARCFRDEDLRADRQPEFTQLDMELAFTPLQDMLQLNERLIRHCFREVAGIELPDPFPQLPYSEAMRRFGSDKPDLRYGMEHRDVTRLFHGSSFAPFAAAAAASGEATSGAGTHARMAPENGAPVTAGGAGGAGAGTGGEGVRAIVVPGGAESVSASRLKKGDVFQEALKGGSKGLIFLKITGEGSFEAAPALLGAITEASFPREEFLSELEAGPGDLVLFSAGPLATVSRTLDRLRTYLAESLGLIQKDKHAILWVTDFPLFERNEEQGRFEALHHPFTAPNPEDMGSLETARALAYDLVYNGVEIGGGSLRIFRRDVQERIFSIIGLTSEEAEEKFGYLLESFDLGAPPHGGIAYGVDRLAMLLAGQDSIRDVIAFPKTTTAQCLLTRAPAPVDSAQLQELSLAKLTPAPTSE